MTKLTLLLFCLAAAFALYPSWRVTACTTDSVNYISIAENIVHGKGAVNFTGRVEMVHPFGYSLAMVPFVALGVPSQSAALYVNWLALVVVGVMAWLLIRDMTGLTDWRVTAGALFVIVTPPVSTFANAVLSETMFAALTMTFLRLCVKVRQSDAG